MAEEQNNQVMPPATARLQQIDELYTALNRVLSAGWPAEIDTMLKLQQLADTAREAVRGEHAARAETADAQNAAQEAISAAIEEMNATADLLYWLACQVNVRMPCMVTPMCVNEMLQATRGLPEAQHVRIAELQAFLAARAPTLVSRLQDCLQAVDAAAGPATYIRQERLAALGELVWDHAEELLELLQQKGAT